jgi:peptidoglycan/LPS O-acetylase OafA/YrhL
MNHPIKIPKDNNFDLLRFLFAFTVFLVHSYVISGRPELSFFSYLSSELAVKSFFVISGFLVTMSYEQTHDIRLYFSKRFRRILPAYTFVVVMSAFGLALLTKLPVTEYLSLLWFKYLVSNLLFLNFLQPTLPGVFENNPLSAVNGALWTLKIEMMFYLTLPIMMWFLSRVGVLRGIVFLYIISLLYTYTMGELILNHGGIFVELQRQLPGQLTYFLSGAALYFFYDKFVQNSGAFVSVALLVYAIEYYFVVEVLKPLALAVIVVYCGCIAKHLGNFGKYGDISYGAYIYHFVILQIFVALGLFGNYPLVTLVAVTFIVLTLSFLSWHIIEKPFLSKSSHYIKANIINES